MRSTILLLATAVLLVVAPGPCAPGGASLAVSAQSAAVHRFEEQVRAYEAEDATHPPPANAILLAGDSQFYRWSTLHDDLPGYTIVNRGIDSFQMSDLLYYADRLVVRYRPRLIVLHVGGNDVHNGRSPEAIAADFKSFVSAMRASLGDVPIVFSSITPGPARWDEAPQRRATNDAVHAYVSTQPHLSFLDLWSAMLKADGTPREDIWVADRIHPNHEGYLIRVALMKPLLGPPDGTP